MQKQLLSTFQGERAGYRARLPRELIIFSVVGVLLSFLAPNPGQTALGVALLPVFFLLLWRPREVPGLLFVAGYQWMQVMLPVMSANFAGISLASQIEVPNLAYGSYLAFVAILFLAVGMRLGRGQVKPELVDDAKREITRLSEKKLMLAYAGSHLVAEAADWLSGEVSGLSQPLSALSGIYWVFVFIIMFAGVVDTKFRGLAAIVFAMELLLGFLGFFSAFKQIIFVTIVVIVAANKSGKQLLRPSLIIAVVGLLSFATAWQAVKEDYRDFLNQGSRTQEIRVSVPERIEFLAGAFSRLTLEDIRSGFESGIERAGYLEYLSRTTLMVPDYIEYQNGRLLFEAIKHPLTPRILFRNKPAIDDSDRVNEFAGVRVADSDQGTSISLGYVAESYVDFGPYFMMLAVLGMGAMWGLMFRALSNASRCRLLSLGFATSLILSQAIFFESSNMKLIGGSLSYFIGAFLILRFLARELWKAIAARRRMGERLPSRR